ncbi:MAG: hypothetical protein GX285_10385 [Clostridiales bacterium]|nr:hypothetical protein [Clostridiales bacterium]
MKIKTFPLVISLLLIFSFITINANANSAEPPALIVIVKNAPNDVSVFIVSENTVEEGKLKKTAWETYYAFYYRSIGNKNQITLQVSGNDKTFYQIVPEDYFIGYNNIITIDFRAQTIIKGKLLSRSIFLVTLRVSFTIIIEGVIFLLFGFRQKKSWIAFLILNLITQGLLNIFLNGASPFMSYLILNLIFMELLVFIAEMICILLFIKEHGVIRRILYVLTANFISLIVGGYMITLLPV